MAMTSSELAEELRSQIHTGMIPAGEKLPPIRQLADAYRVSRGVVDYALRKLRDEGLIISQQGASNRVRPESERPKLITEVDAQGRINIGAAAAGPPGTRYLIERGHDGTIILHRAAIVPASQAPHP